MEIPGLGKVIKDETLGWYVSEPILVPVLGGNACRIQVDGFDEDANKNDFCVAIANFLSIGPEVLQAATPFIFQYYEDCNPHNEEDLGLSTPDQVWKHIRLGNEPSFSRNWQVDNKIYVSLDCNCDWEEEHGLQIVFRNGFFVNKVGPYDGILTNLKVKDKSGRNDLPYVPCKNRLFE